MASGSADNTSSNVVMNNQDPLEDTEQKQLSDEDMARVQEYLSTPIHTVKRKPFRPIFLVIMLLVVMSSLSLLSLLLARLAGVH